MKYLLLCVSVLSCFVALARQTPPGPQFEVASIKPAQPMPMGQMRMGMNADAGMLRYTNVSLRDCIRVAYRVKEFQVEGPDWLGSTHFDIEAKLPDGASKDEIPEMLKAMLADRFKLVMHQDTREHAVYALVVARGGPKLKPAAIPVDGASAAAKPSDGMPKGAMLMRRNPGGMHLTASSVTLANFAEMLSRFSERPVVDKTGIQGNYDFELTFAPETMRDSPGPAGAPPQPMAGGDGPVVVGGDHDPSDSDAPAEPAGSIYDAVQRYGLKLEPKKAPMEFVFVDHIEKVPTEN